MKHKNFEIGTREEAKDLLLQAQLKLKEATHTEDHVKVINNMVDELNREMSVIQNRYDDNR